MKRILFAIAAMVLCLVSFAQVKITTVDKVKPTDEIFMEMAVTAAEKAKAAGLKPSGAVIILNGAVKASGTPVKGQTAEENALSRARINVDGGSVYTINQPSTAALNAMGAAGIEKVFFVNDKGAVVAAGILTEADYDEEGLAGNQPQVLQMVYAPAVKIIK